MATKKATTTDDVQVDETATPPTLGEQVAAVEENTDPAMVADVDQPKTVKVKSPAGFVTEVPQDIVDALKDSGYKLTK
ncbi:MAG: hypothetical protein ACTHQ3_15810 [Motilibacteraceae bacterium]